MLEHLRDTVFCPSLPPIIIAMSLKHVKCDQLALFHKLGSYGLDVIGLYSELHSRWEEKSELGCRPSDFIALLIMHIQLRKHTIESEKIHKHIKVCADQWITMCTEAILPACQINNKCWMTSIQQRLKPFSQQFLSILAIVWIPYNWRPIYTISSVFRLSSDPESMGIHICLS